MCTPSVTKVKYYTFSGPKGVPMEGIGLNPYKARSKEYPKRS